MSRCRPALAALLIGAALSATPASGSAQTAGDVEAIAAKRDAEGRMTVPVHIDAQGPFRFLVDTGAQRSVLSLELAATLALAPIERRRIVGLTGAEIADTTMVDRLALGRRSFSDMLVLLFKEEHIGADGIVGIDSLQGQRVLIDFVASRMLVGSAKAQGGNSDFEIVVTAKRRAGQLIVTDAEVDGVRTAVIIDTGSNTSVGNRALQRALGQRGQLPQAVLVSVTGQEARADLGFARKIGIGSVGITNAVIAYTDGPAFAALDLDRRPAMMLGMRELRLFRRIAIDFSKRKVSFDLPAEF